MGIKRRDPQIQIRPSVSVVSDVSSRASKEGQEMDVRTAETLPHVRLMNSRLLGEEKGAPCLFPV